MELTIIAVEILAIIFGWNRKTPKQPQSDQQKLSQLNILT